MAMEPLPLVYGDFSITMDASLASLWPLGEDAHCYQVPTHGERGGDEAEAKCRDCGAAGGDGGGATQGSEHRRARGAHPRRTAQERDLLQEQHLLLLAHELAAATSSSSDSDPAPGDDRSPLFKLPSSPEATAVVDRPSALFEPSSVENASAAAAAAAGQLELLAAKRPLPHKGRLLQAVMEAGPLLQNLLVAGPLPRWRNPPPVQVSLTNAIISAPSGSGVELLTAPTGS